MVEHVAPPEHRLALRKPVPGAVSETLPARLVGVEKRAFELGPDAVRQTADRRRTDQPGIGPPRGQETLNIVPRHQDIAVGDHDPLMRRRAPALDDIVELRVGADAVGADDQPRAHIRMRRDETVDQRHDGIVCVLDTEDDLVVWIVEPERRAERFLAEILEPANGANQGYRRRVLRQRDAARNRPHSQDRNEDADDLNQDHGGADRACNDRQGQHAPLCADGHDTVVTTLL